MTYPPLTQRFLEAVERHANPRAQLFKVRDHWEPVSAAEMLRRVAGLSRALARLGVQAGDRVGLFCPNRPEWHVADFAILGLGAVDVPVYFREALDRIVYILNDSGTKVVIVIGEEQVLRLLKCRDRLTTVEHIVVGAASPDLISGLPRYEDMIAEGEQTAVAEYRRRSAELSSEQLASIIYTSGTTGEPKGVMLTHANFSSNATEAFAHLDCTSEDIALSVLPLAHVYGRLADYGFIFQGVGVAYVQGIDQVRPALIEARPTVVASVPRFFEKTYANMMEETRHLTGRKRELFDWAMRVARDAVPWRGYGKPAPFGLRLRWWVADKLVFSKIRAGLGGRLRACISGAAPLGRELAEFFWSIGVKVYQGYGLTETSPVVSVNTEGANKIGTVGRPIADVEVRIAADGEIVVRGPCVMRGYYNKPDETREVLDADGWLRTGDIGMLDADGYLVITDRKKDLLKTAGGKYVAPQPIENRLKSSPFITDAALVADRHKFVVALIVPNFSRVEAAAVESGLRFQSRAELVSHPWVQQLLGREIERLTADFAQYEKIKRFALLDHEFTFDDGQLTYTMKLRRRVIERRYRDIIEQLYADVKEPRPPSQT